MVADIGWRTKRRTQGGKSRVADIECRTEGQTQDGGWVKYPYGLPVSFENTTKCISYIQLVTYKVSTRIELMLVLSVVAVAVDRLM